MNSATTPGAGGPQVKSAERALDLLETLAQQPGGLTFTQLLKALGLPKSSLHALLGVLTARRFLELSPEGRVFRLGIRSWEIGQAYTGHHQLVCEARPVLERIVAALNETAQLAVLDGLENLYLAKVDCTHPLRLQSEVGRRLLAHATGLGKMLLAELGDDELAARLGAGPLARFTPSTRTDPAALRRELAQTRARGYALDDQEYTPGLQCVAVPIRDQTGRAAAAASVSIPTMRGGEARLAAALRILAAGSLEISARLGGPADERLQRLAAAPPPPGELGLDSPAAPA